MFMWMLHEEIMEYRNVHVNVTWTDNEIPKCLCECYMITLKGYWNIRMFMWMLHEEIMKYRNVYVNVTWRDNEISKCLCECYMVTLKG
jgi:hypothetical protein